MTEARATKTPSPSVRGKARPTSINGEILHCGDCREWKHRRDFGLTGYGTPKSYCKACGNARRRKRYHSDPTYRAESLQRTKAWRAENAEYVKAENHRRYAADKAARLDYNRQYQRDNREEVNANHRRSYHRKRQDATGSGAMPESGG